jgi:hypothetical protein
MPCVGLRFVSVCSKHGKFAPTVQAYTVPSMQRQKVLSRNEASGTSAGAPKAFFKPRATASGTLGPV